MVLIGTFAHVRKLKRFSSFMSPISIVMSGDRSAHTLNITKEIYYISNDKIVSDPKTMKLSKSPDKPVCIMLTWFQATHKQFMRYADQYLDQGFDVIRVSCGFWQILNPRSGSQVIGRDLMKLLAANKSSFVLHGFSMGGYVWSEAMRHAMANKDLYYPVLDRVEAQVWDSFADITSISIGLACGLYPYNKIAQNLSKFLISSYIRTFYFITTRHHKKVFRTFYASPCRAPALFLLSSADNISPDHRLLRICNLWRNMGIQCKWRRWSDSMHVAHYRSHPEEYVNLVRNHIWGSISAETAEKLRR